MRILMIKGFLLLLLSTAYLPAEAIPICMEVTESDARTVLGLSAKRMNDPSGCAWKNATDKKQMSVALIGVASMFERARADSGRKGTTKTETGLGGSAFSTIPSAQHGERAAIYLVKGSSVLVVDIDGFGVGGAEEHLPQVRDLIRKLVGKL
jgi:hypothetical protein